MYPRDVWRDYGQPLASDSGDLNHNRSEILVGEAEVPIRETETIVGEVQAGQLGLHPGFDPGAIRFEASQLRLLASGKRLQVVELGLRFVKGALDHGRRGSVRAARGFTPGGVIERWFDLQPTRLGEEPIGLAGS